MTGTPYVLLAALAVALFFSSFRWAALAHFVAVTIALGTPATPRMGLASAALTLGVFCITTIIAPVKDADPYPGLLVAFAGGLVADFSH